MMVNIPFHERWREVMLEGRKVCTSRTKQYGEAGDTFKAFGAKFVLLVVGKAPLETISDYFFRQEGCSSPQEFRQIWAELHPRKGFKPKQLVHVHWFKKKGVTNTRR